MDLTTMTDEDLDALRIRVLTEQERRVRLEGIPAQVEEAAVFWREAGRDTSELVTALEGGGADAGVGAA